MKLHELKAPQGARNKRKKVGRGIGSGHGKTCCRGTKGQKAKDTLRPGFEGGQTTLYMRLRKQRGRAKGAMPLGMFRRTYAIINVSAIDELAKKLGCSSQTIWTSCLQMHATTWIHPPTR